MSAKPMARIWTAKIVKYFGLSKKNRFLGRFFVLRTAQIADLAFRKNALLHGVLSVVSRCSVGKIRQGIRNGNLNKQHFLYFWGLWSLLGSSLVHPWFVLGLLYEGDM